MGDTRRCAETSKRRSGSCGVLSGEDGFLAGVRRYAEFDERKRVGHSRRGRRRGKHGICMKMVGPVSSVGVGRRGVKIGP